MPKSCRLSSTSKHLGAEISSRFIPPKLGAIRRQVSIIFCGSLVSMQMGQASIFPNSRKRRALPYKIVSTHFAVGRQDGKSRKAAGSALSTSDGTATMFQDARSKGLSSNFWPTPGDIAAVPHSANARKLTT